MSYFHLYLWKVALPIIEFLVNRFISCSALNLLSHCLLASMISDGKLAIYLSEDALYVTNNFSLATFKIPSFFVPLTFSGLMMMRIMRLSVNIFVFFVLGDIEVLGCLYFNLSNLGSFHHSFCKNSLCLFFLSLWNSHNLILRLAVFHWPIFMFTGSFVCSVCCWKSLAKISFQLLYLQVQKLFFF